MRYLSAFTSIFALILAASPVAVRADDIKADLKHLRVTAAPYKTYVNARFGYQLNYPPDLLVPQGESDNSDGQKFLAKKGDAEMLVWGHYKVDGDLDSELKQTKASDSKNSPKKQVTYTAGGKDWFAISGTVGDRIFYQKTCLRGDTFRTVVFSYSQAEKDKYSPVVDNVVATFKWSKNSLTLVRLDVFFS